jgi:hypothetical protein
MGLFGELLSLPLKVVNVPLRAAENVMSGDVTGKNTDEDDRILSLPIKAITDELEKL